MIEDLKKLSIDSLITIDNDEVKEFTGEEDFNILNIKNYSHENGELVILEFDYFCLIAHDYEGEARYFLTELLEEGENLGYLDNEEFPESLYLEYSQIEYEISKLGVVDDMLLEQDYSDLGASYSEFDFCEYTTEEKNIWYTHVFLESMENFLRVFHGFEINEKDIVI